MKIQIKLHNNDILNPDEIAAIQQYLNRDIEDVSLDASHNIDLVKVLEMREQHMYQLCQAAIDIPAEHPYSLEKIAAIIKVQIYWENQLKPMLDFIDKLNPRACELRNEVEDLINKFTIRIKPMN